jgi:hypothetical protein
MASVMAIESEVFGSCVGEIDDLIRAQECKWLALLRENLSEVCIYRKSGLRFVVEGGDGARY